MRPRLRSSIRPWAALLATGAMGFALARCGAQNAKAPVGEAQTQSNRCSIQATMPAFYAMLTDPSQPLAGIQEVVDALADGQPGQLQGNSLMQVLEDALQGLGNFAQDPMENNGSCIIVTAAVAPPDAPLCALTPASPCENRLCDLRRALDFGVHDEAASTLLTDLQPLLAKIVGYISNVGPGAEGTSHYPIVQVFQSMAEDEARCSPANLIDVLDGVVVYFRSNRACFQANDCPGLQMLQDLQKLINDPAMQAFLQQYVNAEATDGGPGRAQFQALGSVLETEIANMPDNSMYFNQVDHLVGELTTYLRDNNTDGGYDNLITEINDVVADTQTLLNPERPGSFFPQMEAVASCISVVDSNQEIVGALYDLLSRPGGPDMNGLDLSDLTNTLVSIAEVDQDGVLMGALNAVLASVRASDQDMETIREFLVQFLTEQNAEEFLPPLQTMITEDVLNQFLAFMDDLVYGCQPSVSQ